MAQSVMRKKAALQPLAEVVQSVMHLNSVLEPVQDLNDAAFESKKGNIEAGKRPTPTILPYAFSCARVATDILQQKKIRKTRKELIIDQVNQHKFRQKVRSSRMTAKDIVCDEQCVAYVALVPASIGNHVSVPDPGSHICTDQIVSV